MSLTDFDFWAGAYDTVKYLIEDEFDTIENILIDLYPEGMTETELNDFFWFEEDTIAEWLGYDSFEDLISERS
jgi:hypothetical protein